MATWQFDLFAIPSSASLPTLGGYGWDIPPLQASSAGAVDGKLRSWLGAPRVLFEPALTFGHENGNRVDLLSDQQGVELHIRLDARKPDPVFAGALCSVLRSADCILFAPESGTTVSAESEAILVALAGSQAANFCASPGAFLKELGDAV